jgi:phage terminase large subunit-like protein
MNIITTAGFNKEAPCYSVERKMGTDVLTGKVKNDNYFACLWTLDEGDDWQDETTWIKANPSMNEVVSMEFLRGRFAEAKDKGGSLEVDFKTKNLNVWTDAPTVWIPDAVWSKDTGIQISKEDLRGQKCFVGLDFAKGTDMNAACLLFPYVIEGKLICLWKFWMAKDKAKQSGVDFSHWIYKGEIKAVDHPVIRADIVSGDTLNWLRDYDPIWVGYDRYLSTHSAITAFFDAGFKEFDEKNEIDERQLLPFAQGPPTLSVPTNDIYEQAHLGNIIHFDNPVMRWMVGNVVLYYDSNNNCKPDKSKSGNKIDGVMALIFARTAQMQYEYELNEKGRNNGPSVYETKDILMI